MNIYIPKKLIGAVLLVLVLCGALLVGLNVSRNLLDMARENYIFEVPRDAIVSVWAHHKAGSIIPPDEIDYNELDTSKPMGQYTNSLWVARWGRFIVPYFDYENIQPNTYYPEAILIIPIATERSNHLMGFANRPGGLIGLNERMFLKSNADVRQILEVLTHELVHYQGGNFHDGPSWLIESHTSAAALEVLAAMCNYREQLACAAFWLSVEEMAEESLRVNLTNNNLEWAYDLFADMFLRDEIDTIAHRKSNRYWAKDPFELLAILQKYGQAPWINLVIPGLLGKELNTGNAEWFDGEIHNGYQEYGVVVGMPFDDTKDAMGWIYNFIRFVEVTLKGGA